MEIMWASMVSDLQVISGSLYQLYHEHEPGIKQLLLSLFPWYPELTSALTFRLGGGHNEGGLLRGIGGCRLGRTPPVLVHLCWTGRRLQVISELVLLQFPQQIKTCSQSHGGVGEGSGVISCHCRQESRADNQQLCEGPIHRRVGVLLGKWEDSAACESMSSSSSRIWSFSLQPGQFSFG